MVERQPEVAEQAHAGAAGLPLTFTMSPERWQLIKDIFENVLDASDCSAYLDSACAGDPELRQEIERLLVQDQAAGDFLSTSLIRPLSLAAAESVSGSLHVGDHLADRFAIARFIGAGGMGEVYEAFDEVLGVRVALKTIRPELARNERVLAQFRSEAQLAREVTHPNVCRIHDLFVLPSAEPLVFLSMEFIEGETLADRLKREGPLAEDEALRVIRQIADGLDAAHAAGVVHRDLKASNVMLARSRSVELRAVVMDFGIASAVGQSGSSVLLAGTPRYMAPEQLRNEPTTALSDIFALGVIAHEVLTGEPPAMHSDGPAREVAPRLRPRWRRGIAQCLNPDPARRPQNARAFIAVLDPPNATRRNVLLGLAGAAVLGGTAVWRNQLGSPPAAVFVIPFLPAADDQELAKLGQAIAADVIQALTSCREIVVIGEESTRIAAASLIPTEAASSPLRTIASDEASARNIAMAAGRQLRIQCVLFGMISRSDRTISLRVSLRSARDGAVLWAQVFADEEEKLPRFRGSIAAGVVTALNSALGPWAKTAFALPLTANVQAYQLFLLGRAAAARRGVPDLEQSLEHFAEAIRLDDNFAEAHAALAASHNILAGRLKHPLAVSLEAARTECQRALSLSPGSGAAHVVMGSIYQRFDWNWAAADSEYRAALSANPGMAIAHQWYSGLLSIRRLPDEAVFESSRARDLEPLSLPANTAYGAMLYRARRYREAIAQLEFTMKLAPSYQPAAIMLGKAYAQMGEWDAAIRTHRLAADDGKVKDPWVLSWLASTLAAAGRRDEAASICAELERRWPAERFSPSALAQIHQGLGDLDGTFRWLEIALAERDPSLTILRADPGNDGLRHDPRYERIVRELNR